MPNRHNPKNELEQQYYKEYRRIQQAIRRAEKQGYIVPEKVTPKTPSKVKNITPAKIEKLSKLTPAQIRKMSKLVVQDKPEPVDAGGGAKQNKKTKQSTPKRKRKSPNQTSPTPEPETLDQFWYNDDIDNVPDTQREYYPDFAHMAITGYLKQLQQFPNAEGARVLKKWLMEIIDECGRDAVAVMLDVGSRNGNILTWETVYKGGLMIYITNMMEYLPCLNETDKLYLTQMLEEMESWEAPT